jgi:hypothetical protein
MHWSMKILAFGCWERSTPLSVAGLLVVVLVDIGLILNGMLGVERLSRTLLLVDD